MEIVMDAQPEPRRHGMDAMVEPWHDEGGGQGAGFTGRLPFAETFRKKCERPKPGLWAKCGPEREAAGKAQAFLRLIAKPSEIAIKSLGNFLTDDSVCLLSGF